MIIDASVAVKLLVPEDGSDRAQAVVLAEGIAAPDLILVEVASAIWSKLRRGEVSGRTKSLRMLPIFVPNLVSSADLVEDALDLALSLGHPVYDCFYLALAIRRDEQLVTADRRFVAAVSGGEHRHRVFLLSNWSVR